MSPSEKLPGLSGTDPCLQPFLQAESDASASLALAGLMRLAAPTIASFFEKKSQRTSGVEIQDGVSEARVQLAASLQRMRARNLAAASLPPRSIADFHAFVFAVARTAWATLLRQHNPGRTMLFNRLRYLLGNHAGQSGFALWIGPDGRRWAGFDAWSKENPDLPRSLRHQQLRIDPTAAAKAAFGKEMSWTTVKLPVLVAGLFSWLGEPVPLLDLTSAIAVLQGISSEMLPLTEAAGNAAPHGCGMIDRRPSPHDALRWKEYLEWLWRMSAGLTLPQRRAFLLHSTCLREMELLGLTSIRQTAAALEIPIEQMAEFWNALPVEDRLIALLLGTERQRVVNLRKAARTVLGHAWYDFIA